MSLLTRLFFTVILIAASAIPVVADMPVDEEPAANRVVEIITGEWAPYVSRTLPGNGPAAQVIARALQKSGYAVRFRSMPWKRAEVGVLIGTHAVSLPWIKTPRRSISCGFSLPIMQSRTVFFYRTDRLQGFDYTTLENMKMLRIGGCLGHGYEDELRQSGLRVDWSTSIDNSINKLRMGRVDLVIEEERVGWLTIQRLYPDEVSKFAVVNTSFRVAPLHVMINKSAPGSRQLMNAINGGLQKLQASGEYRGILVRNGFASLGR